MEYKIDESILNEQIDEKNVLEKEKKFKLYLKELYGKMKVLPDGEKREFGIKISAFREKFENLIQEIKNKALVKKEDDNAIDITLSKPLPQYGSMHPLNRVYKQFENYYINNGYNIISGPEIELDKYNC